MSTKLAYKWRALTAFVLCVFVFISSCFYFSASSTSFFNVQLNVSFQKLNYWENEKYALWLLSTHKKKKKQHNRTQSRAREERERAEKMPINSQTKTKKTRTTERKKKQQYEMKLYYSKYMWCVALCVDLSFKLIHTYNLHIIWNRRETEVLFCEACAGTAREKQKACTHIMSCGLRRCIHNAFMRECNSDKSHILHTKSYSESLSIARLAYLASFSLWFFFSRRSIAYFIFSSICISLSCVGTYIQSMLCNGICSLLNARI